MVVCRQSLFAEIAAFSGLSAQKTMKTYLTIAQLVVSSLLIVAILLQARGTGLGSTFGGEGNVYRTKRGVEKTLFRGTIVLSVAFFGLALASLFLSRI